MLAEIAQWRTFLQLKILHVYGFFKSKNGGTTNKPPWQTRRVTALVSSAFSHLYTNEAVAIHVF